MPSKITLALVACVAYRTASVMALPMQTSYDLAERDYFDNDFEDFVVREVTAPTADAPPVAAVPATEPVPPVDAKNLAASTNSNGAPVHPHAHHHHHHRHHPHHHNQNGQRQGPHHNRPVVSTGTGAKEAAVVSPKVDASTPAAAQAPLQATPQDPTAPAPALSRRWAWLEHFIHGNPKPQAPSGSHLANVGPKAPANPPAGSDLTDPISNREVPADSTTPATDATPKIPGASKLETPAEGTSKPHELAAEGTKATKPHHHHRHRQSHRTTAQIMADPTLTEKARRRALRRAALREKRLAHISEQAGESHQLTKHRLDTTTGGAKVAPEGAAAPVAPAAAPVGASRRR